LEVGANIDAIDHRNWTPLHDAAANGYSAIVAQLLEAGADIEATNNDGFSALHIAAINDQAEMVELLLEKGDNIESIAGGGWSALHCAVVTAQSAMVELLLEKGANIEAMTNEGSTPVELAALKHRTEIVKMLLAKNVIVNKDNAKLVRAINRIKAEEKASQYSPIIIKHTLCNAVSMFSFFMSGFLWYHGKVALGFINMIADNYTIYTIMSIGIAAQHIKSCHSWRGLIENEMLFDISLFVVLQCELSTAIKHSMLSTLGEGYIIENTINILLHPLFIAHTAGWLISSICSIVCGGTSLVGELKNTSTIMPKALIHTFRDDVLSVALKA
jgi:hypothetical protein